MSVDNCQVKSSTEIRSNVDITWNRLISDSEKEILACKDKVKNLRKAIKFFKSQEEYGVPFPDYGKT
jgi:hypothetical protein